MENALHSCKHERGGGGGKHLLPLDFFKNSKLKKEGNIPNINAKN
jgi:hypothetical protein